MDGWAKTLCSVATLIVALLSIGLGLRRDLPVAGGELTAPRWSHDLEPLARAPLPRGHTVLVILPRGLSSLDAERLFFETVWWRPFIRWQPVRTLGLGPGPTLAVEIDPGLPGKPEAAPPGWREVWQSGWIHVLAKTGKAGT